MTDLVNLAISAAEIDRILAGEVVRFDLPDSFTGELACVVFVRLHKEEPTIAASD